MHLDMTRFRASLLKELRLILRDREALLLLFIMPLVFVVIMSFALQQPFDDRAGLNLPLLVVNQDKGAVGEKLAQHFVESHQFRTDVRPQAPATMDDDLRKGRYKFAIVIPADFTARAA